MANVKYARAVPFSAKGGRKAPKTENKNIIKLSQFFDKIVKASGENAPVMLMKIAKRLKMSNRNRPVVKLSKIVTELGNETQKVAVVVAKILDDERVFEIPAIKVVALKWSKSAQEKIEKNGGSISTLDQFIKVGGSLDNLVLMQEDSSKRKASKYFGPAPGEKGSATYPRANHKIKNKERRINYKKPVSYEDEDSN